jgi:hypothetical protein
LRFILIMKIYLFLLIVLISSCSEKSRTTDQSVQVEDIANPINNEVKIKETDEQKAVRIAEEFVKINGYTDISAEKAKIKYESIEFASNLDELLKQRKNTLESNAYGVSDFGKMTEKGWTVVFKIKNLDFSGKMTNKEKRFYENAGRALTMDENFENLVMQHKDFPLGNAKRKL